MLATISQESWVAVGVATSTNVLTWVGIWAVWAKEKRKRLLMQPVTQLEFQEHKKDTSGQLDALRATVNLERNKDTDSLRHEMSKMSDRVNDVESRMSGLEGKVDTGFNMMATSLGRIETILLSR